VLLDNGFVGRIYNGQGTGQWLTAGYDLVNSTESVVPPCLTDDEVQKECKNMVLSYQGQGVENSAAPSLAPAPAPSSALSARAMSVLVAGLGISAMTLL
jgi:hypothetical protein